MRRSLRTQISLTIISIVLLTVAIVSFSSYRIIQRNFENYIIEQQNVRITDMILMIASRYDQSTQQWDEDFIHGVGMYALSDGYIIRISDRNGQVIWDAENHDMSQCSQIMIEISERMAKGRPGINGGFSSSIYALKQGEEAVGSMEISYYGPYFFSDNDFRFLDSLNLALLIIGALFLLLSVVVGTVLARWIARPILKTAYIAKQISAGNYAIRFEGQTKVKELDELVLAVNHLTNALETQENLRKQLTGDVAHELRTPLTTVASHLEAMIEGVWEPTAERLLSCYEEIGRLSGLVADLEQLARVEEGNLKLDKSAVDLFELSRSIFDNFETEFKKKGIVSELAGESSVVFADRSRISQVIINVLSNALEYTPAQGRIRLEVRNDYDDGLIIIEDTGIGIAEEKLSFIFERFYRTDESRSRRTGGAGIGLTIVKSIISAHNGTIAAESEANQGTRFTIRLPKC